jgi:Uma2 family endonuclease
LAFAIHRHIQGGSCEVFTSEVNVVNEAIDLSAHADVVVRCSPSPLDLEREMTDPTACFEVLSPSTRQFDQGNKLSAYFQTESIKAIALIHADDVRVEVRLREAEGFRELVLKRLGDVLPLPALQTEIPLAENYEGVDIEA